MANRGTSSTTAIVAACTLSPQNSAWSTQSKRIWAWGQAGLWLVVKRLELFHRHNPLLPAMGYMAHHKLAGGEEGLVRRQ